MQLSQARTIAGSKAFTGIRPRRVAAVSNGVKYTMKRKDSYMVEVEVGEDEPEDIAVRKFMKKVLDSRVIEQLRARRYKETPLEEFKRRTRERIELRKNKVVFPTYEEEHGPSEDPKPFDDFFQPDPETLGGYPDDAILNFGTEAYYADNQMWGGYVDRNGAYGMGGYAQQGGYYMNPQQGAYPQQGGYMMPPAAPGYAQQPQQQAQAPAAPQQ